ncbi:ester cyclase [Streptomyces sp. NPDC059455]|uniref:ester cyclase n=1 Tax=Streptomyces sp. NPDC059455 TaxID=3346837 RepID=UPI00368B1757
MKVVQFLMGGHGMTEGRDNVSRTLDFVRKVQEGGCLELFDDFVHPDFRNHTAEPGGAADREGARATMAALHAALEDLSIEIVHCFGQGDLVATTKVVRGRHVGNWLGQAPTGKRVGLRIMDFLRFTDGRIIEHWSTHTPLD